MSNSSSQAVSDVVRALTDSLLRRTHDRAAMHSTLYNMLYDENLSQEARTALAAALRDTEEALGDNLRLTANEIAGR